MRSQVARRSLLLAALLSFGASAPTGAQASVLGFTSAIAIHISNLPPLVIPGAGTLTVNGSSGPGHLTSLDVPSSPFAITGFVLPFTDPAVLPLAGYRVTAHNGPGSFAGSGGAGFGGIMPILGTAKVCLYGACGMSGNIANLTIPLTVVGQGGMAPVTGAVNMTVVGAPWTTGTAAIGVITMMGGVAPLSNTNVVTLVTPIFLSTNIGAAAVIPAFASVTFTNLFVPEPGTLALLSSGVVALVAYGRHKARR
jgi:hypothetical protein